MAEVLGTISAIVGLVEFGGSVLCLGYGYISKVARAPKEIRLLLSEIASLESVLDRLRDAADDVDQRPDMERTLVSLSQSGALDSCRAILNDAEECVKTCDQLHERSSRSARNLGRRLLWPFKESETKNMLQRLQDLRDTLTAALTVDSAAALRRIEASQDKIQSGISILASGVETDQQARKHEQLLKWLCPEPSKPDEDLEAALQLRQKNTCEWFFRSDMFNSWVNAAKALFWIYGIAGCGKTIISSTTIQHLKLGPALGVDGAVGYFYCDHNDAGKQTSRHFLMTIATQLVAASADCLDDVASMFATKTKDGQDALREEDYLALIHSMSGHFERIFIVVDALDESQDSESILNSLKQLMTSTAQQCHIRVLITSRNSVHMEHLILPFASFKMALHDHTGADILAYVTSEVKRRLSNRPQRIRDLESLVVGEILDRTQGLFLQAKLQIDYVCPLKTPGDMKRALQNLPSGLEPIYDHMLTQIVSRNSQSLRLLKNIFLWILGSLAPLPLESLAHAVAVRLNDQTIDEDNIADADDLTEMCGSFIDIDQTSTGDRVARVAHFSVIEFFRSDLLAASPRESFFIVPADVHFRLGLICIKYLSLKELVEYLPTSDLKTKDWKAFHEKYPLYRYAANSWMTHLRRSRASKSEFTAKVAPHLQWFLAPDEVHGQYRLWQQVTLSPRRVVAPESKDRHLAFGDGWQPPISYAIGFGLLHVFNALYPNLAGPNERFSNGHTLLTWAVLTDRITIVTRLLELKADPDIALYTAAQKGMTPLHVAAATPNYEIAALLLKHGATTDKKSESGATAFYRAVRSGSIPIMKLLKDAGADINVRTWDNWTPVVEAVRQRRHAVLRLLLEWGADAEVQTPSGRMTWSLAVHRGQSDWMDLLGPQDIQSGEVTVDTSVVREQADSTATVAGGSQGSRDHDVDDGSVSRDPAQAD